MNRIELTHRDDLISFGFAALDFTDPEKNTYMYELEGFRDHWIELGNFRRVSFTNLEPGSYTLKVKAANNDGVWSEEALTLPIRISPPPWASWWAKSLYGILVGSIAFFFRRAYRLARQRETRYRERLEREVAERTTELQRGYEELERLNRELEESSVTDSLTGLRNQRYVFDNIETETAAILRLHDPRNQGIVKRESLVFLMIDLDEYKDINDSHGHDVGDRVLLEVREILESVCRTSDILVRWGGDEFLVIGRLSEQADAEVLAERIRTMLFNHQFTGRAGQSFRTTCSIGFACLPFLQEHPELMSWRQVLTIADRALYVAKNNGRNAWVGLMGRKTSSPENLFQTILELPRKAIDERSLEVVTSLSEGDVALVPVKATDET